MLDDLIGIGAFVAALGAGLIAGVFFAFSTFVVRALARLPHAQGLAAMQSINIVVINPWFLGPFLGVAALGFLLAPAALLVWPQGDASWVLVGAVAYIVGTYLITMRCHVPRNQALAKLGPDDPDAVAAWSRYVAEWTVWNHVRTAAALVAAAAFTLAII